MSAYAKLGDVPQAPTAPPPTEGVASAIGAAGKYATENHAHERLTSARTETLDATGFVTTAFTRTFAVEPCPILTAVAPGGSQPVMLQVDSWIKTGALWTGAVIRGYRGQPLPASLTLLSALISFNVNAGSAAGVRVSCVFLMPSI